MTPDESKGAERRKEPRVPARIEVRFKDPQDAAKAFRVYSLNCSAGGLCLRPTRKYDVGEELELSMQIGGHEFHLSAVVAWERNKVIGVRFENIDEEDRERLERLAQSL